MLLSLTFAAALLVSPQDAPVAPPAPPAAPAAPAAPSAEELALVSRIEAAGGAMEEAMEDLTPRAEVVRNDASLSDADKGARIRAMMEEHRAAFDGFGDALYALVLYKASAEGASAQDAAGTASMVRTAFAQQIAQILITGEDPDEDDAGE